MNLRITEIFYSLQGESSLVGYPTVFVRLTGCPLRCHYCDTTYSFHGGKKWSFSEIIQSVQRYQTAYVCITGGEPLAQPNTKQLVIDLLELDYNVSIETSGALDISVLDPRTHIVMDLKTPSSGEVEKNRYENLDFLKASDEIKFVIGDRNDYNWSRTICEQNKLFKSFNVLFSPSYEQLEVRQLADWIIEDQLPIRFQVQLHKVIWGDEPGY